MAWCQQATSHYLSQCWPIFMSPYGITTKSHSVKKVISWNCFILFHHTIVTHIINHTHKAHKYSLLMHHIKIKSPANFLWNEQHVFLCWFITFQSVLLWRYYNDKKALDIGGTTIQDVGCLAAMGLAMEPGVHTMSDELILQILCNIFLAFKWIIMMRWGQNKSHYTTTKPSVHVWNHDLIWWQNKIDTLKTFPQDYDYEL